MKLLSKTGALTALLSSALIFGLSGQSIAADKIQLRLASSGSETGTRAQAMINVFGPAVADVASFEPHWNSTLFKQGTELEAIARGNLEMALASAQELAVFFPEYSILVLVMFTVMLLTKSQYLTMSLWIHLKRNLRMN